MWSTMAPVVASAERLVRAGEDSQSRISRIESGDIEHAELATLRAYVQALGGLIRVTADFGDEKLNLA
jgi:predicted transcriptional regulator